MKLLLLVLACLLQGTLAITVCVQCEMGEDFPIFDNAVDDNWASATSKNLWQSSPVDSRDYFAIIPLMGEGYDAPVATVVDNPTDPSSGLDVIVSGEASYGFDWDFYDEDTEDGQELYLEYICYGTGKYVVKVDFDVKVQEGQDTEQLSFFFQKDCGLGGFRDGLKISFGSRETYPDVVQDGETEEDWKFGDKKIISAEDDIIYFSLWVEEEQGSQVFFPPEVEVSVPDLNVLAREEVSQGGVLDYEMQSLSLILQCDSLDTEEYITVSISIEVPPFKPVRFAFQKECPGGVRKGLSVATTIGGSPDVVSNGETLPEYKYLDPQQSFNASAEEVDFWLFIEDAFDYQLFHKPIITVSPNRVLKAFAVGEAAAQDIPISGFRSMLTIQHLCSHKGEAIVTVTIPIPGFEPVEWSYTKICKSKTKIKLDTNVWTANQLMVLFSFGLVFAVGAAWYGYTKFVKGKKAASATIVPITPSTPDL